ncbi:rRNA methyltransferase 3, mitochondrial isoform X1 [Colletes latitarsis]|uniref:rRNA methyltransferase 3, mitochondrial isoform X1 n=1 Tax=Colletes latitarsis TaxID=2605962 RepID=UPI0040364075
MIFINIVQSTLRPLRSLRNLQTINTQSNVTRTYAKWMSRRPAKIVNEDELFEPQDTTEVSTTEKFVQNRAISNRKSNRRKRTEKTPVKSTEISTTKETKSSSLTVLKLNEKVVSSLMTKIKSRKKREKNNEIVLEGRRLIEEGLEAGGKPIAILYNKSSDIDSLKFPEDVKLYKVPYNTIQLWSSLTSSPGLIGIFQTPDTNKDPANNALPLTIICDNVREPGNLGSIMRAAAGVGCERLILMKGCVDLWHPKVLRSAAGAHFRLPINAFPMWDEIPSLISEGANIVLADSNFGDEFISKYSEDVLEMSLGVFGTDPEELKTNIIVDDNITDKSTNSSPIIPTNKQMMKNFLLKLPIVPYYSLDYTRNETVLVLSGETEGLSFDSYKLLKERKGIRINIPLVNGIDSLNTGVALGIVTFEIKRQFIKKRNEP